MRKIILFIIISFFVLGCDNLMNTPTKKVEEFFNKYQTIDNKVVEQLNYTIDNDYELTSEQKEKYKNIMKKQYNDLVYTIKEETVDGNSAAVKVEIEVYDYNKSIIEANNYLQNNQEEFLNEDGTVNKEKFVDKKLELMSKNTDRVKYTLNLSLIKNNDVWKMNDITEIDRQKIHGIYNY